MIGLYGSVYSGVANAQVGDIIQISSDGGKLFYHSYVVTAVKGCYGSRTTNQIIICAHTTDRINTLLSVAAGADKTFRTIHVDGVLYTK